MTHVLRKNKHAAIPKDTAITPIAAVILAGGQSTRMGGEDKGFIKLGNYTLIEHVFFRLQASTKNVDHIVINSNHDASRFSNLQLTSKTTRNLTVIPDCFSGSLGPLAGIGSTMAYFKQQYPQVKSLVTVPGDCPFLLESFIETLSHTMLETQSDIVFATCGEHAHYLNAIWSLSLTQKVADFLRAGGRAAKHFISQCQYHTVHFDEQDSNAFFNINTPEQLEYARRLEKTKSKE